MDVLSAAPESASAPVAEQLAPTGGGSDTSVASPSLKGVGSMLGGIANGSAPSGSAGSSSPSATGVGSLLLGNLPLRRQNALQPEDESEGDSADEEEAEKPIEEMSAEELEAAIKEGGAVDFEEEEEEEEEEED